MVTAGLLLGGAGVAAATDGSSASTTTSPTTTTSTTSTSTTSTSTTSTSTTSTSTSTSTTSTSTSTSTSSSPTTTTSAPTTTTSAPTTTTSAPTTTTSAPGPKGTATATTGCEGEVSVVVTGTDLAEGTEVVVQLVLPSGESAPPIDSAVVSGGIPVVIPAVALTGVSQFSVGVVAGTQAFGPYVVHVPTATTTCTAHATISLARDCTSPTDVLATVAVTGLTPGTYGVGVVGEAADGTEVLLTSEDITVTGTSFAGTLPLLVADGSVELSGFTGIALVIDGKTLASVGKQDVSLAACVAPAPLPVAPAQPVVTTTSAATPLTKPTALAQTGTPASSLALLGVALLGLGGLTTLLARRSAR